MAIQARISTWLILLVLLPTVPILAFFTYSTFRYSAERKAGLEAELVMRADTLAADMRDQIAKSYGYVSSLAVSNSAMQKDVPALYTFAKRIQEGDTGIAAISLIGKDGTMKFLSLRRLGQTFVVGQPEAVREVFRTRKVNLSSPFRSPISDRMVIALSVPVIVDGEVEYCLRAIIRTDLLAQTLNQGGLPQGWISGIVDSTGTVVARSHDAEKFVGRTNPQILQAINQNNANIFRATALDGTNTLTVIRPVGSWGWYLGLAVPVETLDAPVRREIIVLLALGVGMFGLCVYAALRLSRHLVGGIEELVQFARSVESGETMAPSATGILEIDQMSHTLKQLDRNSRQLELLVQERTHKLLEAERRAADFADNLERSVESERQRIAREVHDQIGSAFTGIKMVIAKALHNGLSTAEHDALLQTIDAGVQTSRRIASELRPPLLDDLGLQSALRQMLQVRLSGTGLHYEVVLDQEECLDERQTIGLYRIAQEACTNVLRHANASLFIVEGRRISISHYKISLQDDGVGMADGPIRSGALGIAGMQERARLLNGTLEIARGVAGGSTILVILPLNV